MWGGSSLSESQLATHAFTASSGIALRDLRYSAQRRASSASSAASLRKRVTADSMISEGDCAPASATRVRAASTSALISIVRLTVVMASELHGLRFLSSARQLAKKKRGV